MEIIVVGAVAAGTSAAAKARRNCEEASITIYEKDSFISYSGCTMPYHISGEVKEAERLTPRDPAFFKSNYNIDVCIRHEVLKIDPGAKTVTVKNLKTGEIFEDGYDKLVLATGARPVLPPIAGIGLRHVFTLRSIGDMNRIMLFIKENRPKSAAVLGAGFVGLELCESFVRLGLKTSLIERLPQVSPGLDEDMAVYVKEELGKNGVAVYTGASAAEIGGDSVILSSGEKVPADILLVAAGVRPETGLAKSAGLELSVSGAIRVDPAMRTSAPDIYACGDCAEQFNLITGRPVYRPLGSTANKTGRIAGDSITGGNLSFRGILGTSIFRLFDLAVAQTGLTEREAKEQGYNPVICHNIKPDRPEYMGGHEMVIKGVADRESGRLLGAQIVGRGGVDKRIDVFAAAITYGAKAEDLFHLDLAYAPPFSTAKDPVMYTGMILDGAISRGRALITTRELEKLIASGEPHNIIDTRAGEQYEKSHIETAKSIPHAKLRTEAGGLDKGAATVTYCNRGTTGNAAQNLLLGRGFKRVLNLSGGLKQYDKTHKK